MTEIVLVNPKFDASSWGLEHVLPNIGKRANLPAGADRGFCRCRLPWHRLLRRATLALVVLLVFLSGALPLASRTVRAADAQASLSLAPHGTPFFFEVIDSHDAKYPGDTPAHLGKDGGLTVRPNVALGDPVYRTVNKATTLIGKVTLVLWDRVSGSLTVEFDPVPSQRIAVGDEVWVDLNPLPSKSGTPVPPGTAAPTGASEQAE